MEGGLFAEKGGTFEARSGRWRINQQRPENDWAQAARIAGAHADTPHAKHLIFLGWWRGEEFQTVTAVLKDVSLGGASILLDGPAPEDALVWLSQYQVPPTQWVEATVVEVHGQPASGWFSRKSTMIRIRFFENCSYDFFKVAIEDAPAPPERLRKQRVRVLRSQAHLVIRRDHTRSRLAPLRTSPSGWRSPRLPRSSGQPQAEVPQNVSARGRCRANDERPETPLD